ncbi:hypothetical protein [Brucella tritici]|uniref:hypothetical protein n=1 Tax=Brucella tritici TaxID=94626 RepID=UPI00178C5324|nr:hypothetical protein [Brucella tritici]
MDRGGRFWRRNSADESTGDTAGETISLLNVRHLQAMFIGAQMKHPRLDTH